MAATVGPPHPHILEEELTDELLLFDESQGLFVSLNQSASDIWRLVTGEFSVEEIANNLASSYGADPESVRGDVERVIEDFVEKQLIPPL